MEEFKRIDDAFEYVKEGIKSGKFTPEEVRKIATIKARQGQVGEEIKTVLPSGLEEVKGTVALDETTGRPGWIATNPGGEEYIIPDSSFQKMYEEIPEKPGEFRKIVPVLAVTIDEAIAFTNKYGEEMKVEDGGHLIYYDGARGVLGKGTYGVAAEAWDTYEQTGTSKEDALKQTIELLDLEYVILPTGEIMRGNNSVERNLDSEITPTDAVEQSDAIANAEQAIRDDMTKGKDEPTIDE